MMQEVIADMIDKWAVVREKVSHCPGDRQTDNQRDADFNDQLTLGADPIAGTPQPEYHG
ncbi:Uncharacterised protein [Salmonella enterica subsp. enterica serovar Sanjuan]|uniref:Uncharacterized protein n=1 Tax=Salmonella enterica subsp. enterica serovar Sanjuan TaxID=1160765 RepID=A0A3S4IU40_SALET|nr:Uncharacterised protein [Salmonella enterica subsp. enterica serovar Sanjuan]